MCVFCADMPGFRRPSRTHVDGLNFEVIINVLLKWCFHTRQNISLNVQTIHCVHFRIVNWILFYYNYVDMSYYISSEDLQCCNLKLTMLQGITAKN